MAKPLPTLVLVGRPNVGKSTLFNRLTGTRRAIVTAIPGTTRDVIAHGAEWNGMPFTVVDTGGMFGASEDPLHQLVLERGYRAIADADLLVLVVDGRAGVVPGDEQIAEVVRRAGKPAILAVNKMDDRRAATGVLDAHRLGFEPVYAISAEHSEGIGDLLDEVVQRLAASHPRAPRPAAGHQRDDDPAVHEDGQSEVADDGTEASSSAGSGEVSVAIVGRPNAGKSSLVNRLLREERMIVSEVPGTTRDAVDTVLQWHRRQFRIVDTAGIRRPGRVAQSGQVESVSVLLSRRSIETADIVVLVVDAAAGVTDQDAAIAGEADRLGKGIIIVANKWDLMKGNGSEFVKLFDERVRDALKFLDYAPLLHISAATGERTPRLLEVIDRIAASRRTRVRTSELNPLIERISAQHPPASPGRKHVRILYAVQSSVEPPTFVFFTNVATEFHFSYQRYLENQLREAFGFEGTPIRLQVRSRRERSSSVRTAAGGGGTAKSRGGSGRGGAAKAGARRAGTARKRKRSG
jgi:GTP-binding protein